MMSEDDTNKNNEVEEEHPVDKIFGLKDPNSLSAFEVYSTGNHEQSNHSNINNANRKAVTNTISNPVRLVREAARKFGLTVLSSELEKIRYLYSGSQLMSLTRMESYSSFCTWVVSDCAWLFVCDADLLYKSNVVEKSIET
jgi:hypothetical protein